MNVDICMGRETEVVTGNVKDCTVIVRMRGTPEELLLCDVTNTYFCSGELYTRKCTRARQVN